VVPLFGDQREKLEALSDVLAHYMLQSEQLETKMLLAANDQAACGVLIQRMPREGTENLGQRADEASQSHADFEHVAALLASLGQDELLAHEPMELLHRLFWNEKLLRHPPASARFACTCSRERVAGMLRGLGQAEVQSILDEQGQIEVGCEFCGVRYRFDAVDSSAALAGVESPVNGSSVH
jgi:molecular chaperone Hsp33